MSKWWRGLNTAVRSQSALSKLQFQYSQSSLYHTIQAIPRESTGRRSAVVEREQGRIPAVVFSQAILDKETSSQSSSRKQLLTTERKQIQSLLKSVELPYFCSTTFGLQIRAGAGSSVLVESGTVLPIKVHRNEETGKILNLVFVWAEDGTELKVNVPVVLKGEEDCPGLKKGGRLNMIRKSLKFLCPAEHIPQKIEVDLSNLDVGDKVSMNDIEVHYSAKLLSKNLDIPICNIQSTDIPIWEGAKTDLETETPEAKATDLEKEAPETT
ncbi:50S ribosomal protein L25 [Euphorbia peplus]|nr:50S ribosomal protein L25 [Euphorbia peplus]